MCTNAVQDKQFSYSFELNRVILGCGFALSTCPTRGSTAHTQHYETCVIFATVIASKNRMKITHNIYYISFEKISFRLLDILSVHFFQSISICRVILCVPELYFTLVYAKMICLIFDTDRYIFY